MALEAQVGDPSVLDARSARPAHRRTAALTSWARGRGAAELAEVARTLVVLEDEVAVEVVHQSREDLPRLPDRVEAARPRRRRRCRARSWRAPSRVTPRRRISGCAQWWLARMQTFVRLRSSATSWGWIPARAKETTPPRASALGGPKTRNTLEPLQALERVRGERMLVCAHPGHSDRLRGSRWPRQGRPPGRSSRSRPRTSTAARSRSNAGASTVAIMSPPARNGGICSSSSARA